MVNYVGTYLALVALVLLPYALAAGIFFVLFRVASRIQSPIRPLVLYPAIGSALLSAAFLIWAQLQWFSAGPTSKSLMLALVPLCLVLTIIAGFIASWSLVYVVRFVQETAWKQEPKLTRLIFFIPALLILGFTVWTVQGGVRRSLQLGSASSETTDQPSKQRLLDHDRYATQDVN